MKKSTIIVAALLLFTGLATQSALAQSGSLGCGGGNGAAIACNGTVTESGLSVSSTGITTSITGTSGLPSAVAGFDDFTPQSEAMSLSFSNVGLTFGSGGTFTLTDAADGDFSISGTAELGSTLGPTLTGPLTLVLNITSVSLGGGTNDDGLTFSVTGLTGISGAVDLNLDPGNVTSLTGTFGLPPISGGGGPGPTPTPEPGSLLLLSTGLIGVGGAFRRRFLSL